MWAFALRYCVGWEGTGWIGLDVGFRDVFVVEFWAERPFVLGWSGFRLLVSAPCQKCTLKEIAKLHFLRVISGPFCGSFA